MAGAEGARGAQRVLSLSQGITSACEQACTLYTLHTLQEKGRTCRKAIANVAHSHLLLYVAWHESCTKTLRGRICVTNLSRFAALDRWPAHLC